MKISQNKLHNILDFINELENLKMTMRHSWLSNGRRESVAEHTWRNALMAMIIAPELDQRVDVGHVVQMILVHDLGEIYTGDRPAWKPLNKNKHREEEDGIKQLTKNINPEIRTKILTLWEEYEENNTPEAHLAKAVDKMEVLIQHNQAGVKKWNKAERTEKLALHHGDKYCEYDPTIKALKDLIREDTRKELKKL